MTAKPLSRQGLCSSTRKRSNALATVPSRSSGRKVQRGTSFFLCGRYGNLPGTQEENWFFPDSTPTLYFGMKNKASFVLKLLVSVKPSWEVKSFEIAYLHIVSEQNVHLGIT